MNERQNLKKLENSLNELKGNLFEFLVGQLLARHFHVEEDYLTSLPRPFRQQLSFYESLLRQNDRELLKLLPHLAQEVVQVILTQLSVPVERVLLVGKLNTLRQLEESLGEADLLLFVQNKVLPLSLKLCKVNAFVNTKNAGVQSFLKKYFSFFTALSGEIAGQQELNLFLTESFLRMGHELYQCADLDFPGYFDYQWGEAGYSDLPGELPPHMRNVVYEYYSQVITKIYSLLQSYRQRDPEQFLRALYPLCGFADPKILQVICFHGEGKESRYQLKGIHLLNLEDCRRNLDHVAFPPLKKGISSFAINMKDSILQIRVKPMNKFTVPSPKVNCSVKFLESKLSVNLGEIESEWRPGQNFPPPA